MSYYLDDFGRLWKGPDRDGVYKTFEGFRYVPLFPNQVEQWWVARCDPPDLYPICLDQASNAMSLFADEKHGGVIQ